MKINKIRLILWLIVIVLLLITYSVFSKTLALFEDNASGEVNPDIGRWIIYINGNSISDGGTNQDIVIDSFTYTPSQKVENNYIAPGGSAYFDLFVDATDCDVAVRYDITFNFDSMDYSDNISISVEEVGNNNTILTDENTYSGVISLASIENDSIVNIRVHVTWNDISTYDEDDTELGTQYGSKLTVPITVHAEQYLGETLVPYVPPLNPGNGD